MSDQKFGGYTLDELEALEKKNEPGPWRVYDRHGEPRYVGRDDGDGGYGAVCEPDHSQDCEIIAAARNALPDLIRSARKDRLMEWQPISTAPKDETEIIVGFDIATVWIVRSARYVSADEDYPEQEEGWWSYRNSVGQEKLEDIYEPTHWLPMPEPPNA